MSNSDKNSVLIVDDEKSNLEVLSSILTPDYTVYMTKSGAGAIEMAEKYVPDLILLDIIMPDTGGYDVLKALKASSKTEGIPVIFISGFSSVEDEEKGLDFGAAGFIQKPFSPKIVKSKVRMQMQMSGISEVDEAHAAGSCSQPANSRLIDAFVRDAQKTVAVLEEFSQAADYSEDNLQKYAVVVHGIKSPLMNIGEVELSATAQKLETAKYELDIGLITSLTPKFLNGLNALLEKFRLPPGSALAEEFDDKDPPDLRDKFLAIKDMCAAYNRKGILDIIADMKNCSKETRAALDKIKENAMYCDFDEAETAAVAYIREL